MKTEETIELVKNAVVRDKSSPIDHCHLINDLNLDSLSLVDLIAEIEDELDITIYANHLYEIDTVDELRQHIHKCIPEVESC